MHFRAFQAWSAPVLQSSPDSTWTDYLNTPEVQESFKYVREHQRRIILEYYPNNQEVLFDSLWRFGGSLLPADPLRPELPEHRMNGVPDWFYRVPQIDASLRASDANDIDMALARAWQVGIIADGLLRTDSERPQNERMPIPDFQANEPDLKERRFTKWLYKQGINFGWFVALVVAVIAIFFA